MGQETRLEQLTVVDHLWYYLDLLGTSWYYIIISYFGGIFPVSSHLRAGNAKMQEQPEC